ncbi:MAG: FliM/FliN family flagellar motor switch protein [Planctomycetales bacterium]
MLLWQWIAGFNDCPSRLQPVHFKLVLTPLGLDSVVRIKDTTRPLSGHAFRGHTIHSLKNRCSMTDTENVKLDVTIELGRARLDTQSYEELTSGDLVALEQAAEEPVNIYANGMPAARGVLVVVDHKFCVRVTELVAHVNALA